MKTKKNIIIKTKRFWIGENSYDKTFSISFNLKKWALPFSIKYVNWCCSAIYINILCFELMFSKINNNI